MERYTATWPASCNLHKTAKSYMHADMAAQLDPAKARLSVTEGHYIAALPVTIDPPVADDDVAWPIGVPFDALRHAYKRGRDTVAKLSVEGETLDARTITCRVGVAGASDQLDGATLTGKAEGWTGADHDAILASLAKLAPGTGGTITVGLDLAYLAELGAAMGAKRLRLTFKAPTDDKPVATILRADPMTDRGGSSADAPEAFGGIMPATR